VDEPPLLARHRGILRVRRRYNPPRARRAEVTTSAETGARHPSGWPELLGAAAPFLALGFALFPLALPFWGHDLMAHVVRIAQVHRGVTEGVFYPLYLHDVFWGFGAPLMLFNPPFPYLLAELIVLLGAGPVGALKLGLALGFAFGAAAVYALARPALGRTAAGLAAAAYAIAPYRLLDGWVRAAYPELIATALLPLMLLAARRTATARQGRGWAWVAVTLALLLLTHAPTSLVAIALATAYGLLWSPPGTRAAFLLRLSLGIALGFGLSAFYLLPAAAELGRTQFQESIGPNSYFFYGYHFIELRQLVDTRWGYGESMPGAADGMSFQIGRVHLAAMAGALAVAWRGPRAARRELAFWLIASATAVSLTNAHSAWVWRALPLLHPFQFPWRMLMVPALGASLCVGGLALIGERWPPWARGALAAAVLAALVASYARFVVPLPPPRPIEPRVTPEALQRWIGAHPVWLPRGVRPDGLPGPRLVAVAGTGDVQLVRDATHLLLARSRAATPIAVRFRIFAFPDWQAFVDGVRVPTRADRATGGILLALPAGEHEIQLQFAMTPIRRTAAVVSLVTVVLAGVAWIALSNRR
jgi:hypothetical protein